MKPAWFSIIKYIAVGVGSLFAFFILVIGAAGVHAAWTDYLETNVEQQVALIEDEQLGKAIMPIVQMMNEEANRQLSGDVSLQQNGHHEIMREKMFIQLNETLKRFSSKDDQKIVTLVSKWVDTGYSKQNWLQVKNDTWLFMKEAAERDELFWNDIHFIPSDLQYKATENE